MVMGLGSSWWSGSGAASRYGPEFGTASVSQQSVNDFWDLVRVNKLGRIYQREYNYQGNYVRENGGYFYLLNTANDVITDAADCFKLSPSALNGVVGGALAVEQFDGDASTTQHLPIMLAAGEIDEAELEFYMATRPSGAIGAWGPFYLMHYQPLAWYGTVAEVVASMLMQLGISTDYIDTDGIDEAYDAAASTALVAREYGTKIVDTIKELATHDVQLLGYTMAGKLTMRDRVSPDSVSGLSGVKSMTWRYAPEHLCNKAKFTFGQITRVYEDHEDAPTKWNNASTFDHETDNSDYEYRCEWEPTFKSAIADTWSHTLENAASVTKYGELPLGGTEITENGRLATVLSASHLRFLIAWDITRTVAMTTQINSDATMRRELTVVQDLNGLDYDIGHEVTDISLGGDTAADFKCIHKSIDFDTLTVTSVLLEE